MTLTLGNRETLLADAATHPDAAAAGRLDSIVRIAYGMMEFGKSLNVGRFIRTDGELILQLKRLRDAGEPKADPPIEPFTFYRIQDEGGRYFWVVASQSMERRRESGDGAGRMTKAELRTASRIEGDGMTSAELFERAMNEVEKAWADLEARP